MKEYKSIDIRQHQIEANVDFITNTINLMTADGWELKSVVPIPAPYHPTGLNLVCVIVFEK